MGDVLNGKTQLLVYCPRIINKLGKLKDLLDQGESLGFLEEKIATLLIM